MPIVQKIEVREIYKKKRVAAYARVSTHKENQEESFETQVKYYETLIKSNPNWTFTKVYADHGFSGVSAEKRPGFMEMVRDGRWGTFDILLVRSISRFARNVKEAQIYCRELKIHGIEVRFERERISSADPSAEMAFNLLAACAQEESRSISERTKWSVHKLQEQGIYHIGNRLLGYEEIDGVLTPDKEAWVVKQVFELYAAGKTPTQIADHISRTGYRREKDLKKLDRRRIYEILRNPTYVGDRFLQQKAPKNYMTHKPDWKQEYDSYHLKDSHESIISRELWDKVQARLERKTELFTAGAKVRGDSHFLYGKMFCGLCGLPMKRKLVTSGGEKRVVWKCADRFKGKQGNGCKNDIVREWSLLEGICVRLEIDAETFEERVAALERRANEIDRIIVAGKNIEVLTFATDKAVEN